MSTEKDIYQSLRYCFREFDFTRIETMTEAGIPDVNYCTKFGTEGWIELKIGPPRLKPSQVSWHTRAIANHRRAFILTLYRNGLYILYRTDKFQPIDTKHFTPAVPPIMSTNKLVDISSCLTSSY